jgi:hypothetical protein
VGYTVVGAGNVGEGFGRRGLWGAGGAGRIPGWKSGEEGRLGWRGGGAGRWGRFAESGIVLCVSCVGIGVY